MDIEFWPEALQDWTKGCPGCIAREALNAAFIKLDKSCRDYATALQMLPLQFDLSQSPTAALLLTSKTLDNYIDWHRRVAERQRLSDLAIVLLYYLAEQYGELDTHLRDGVAASDEYVRYAKESTIVRQGTFETLQANHNDLMAKLDRPNTHGYDVRSQLLAPFAELESVNSEVVACTQTLWESQQAYLEDRAAQAFKVSVSGG